MQYAYTAQIHGKKFTSGKSNLTTGHIAAAAPHMDGSMVLKAHWLHLVNTTELLVPSPTRVYNPNGKSISSAVLAQLTAESPILYNGRFFPPKIAPSHWDLDPYLTHGSLGQPQSSIQTASRSVQPFLQGSLV